MAIHYLNCFSCSARVPAHWHTGTMCLVVDTDQGPVLVDTGLGEQDYLRPPAILRVFQAITIVPLDPDEAAVRQLARLGYRRGDVRHIVLTHMHFDHCGGLPDFPEATVHVHRREHEAFFGRRCHWTELAYVRRHGAHHPHWALYQESGERWFDFEAIRLPFEPEMWMVPLHGHSRGHCGIAIRDGEGWLFHVGDSAAVEFSPEAPEWLVRLVLGPHQPRLRRFGGAHPEVRMTTGHMWLSFFGKP